jgi:hypothetical protein
MTTQLPAALARIAERQHDVVTRKQALRAGLSIDAVRSRVRRGTWRQLFRGVYVTSGRAQAISQEARYWAAVLYCGRGAVLSHQTAAALHGLTVPNATVIHVSIPVERTVTAVPGLRIHRTGRPLDPPDGHHDPPHTPIWDTLLDLADEEDTLDGVCAWLTDAFSQGKLNAPQLLYSLAERARARWRSQLTDIVGCAASGDHSVLEYRYTRDVERAHGLPEAERQVRFRKPDGSKGRRDRLYPEYGVIIELDGILAHPRRRSWADKDRDRAALCDGLVTARLGWLNVNGHPCQSAAEVARILRRNGWTGTLQPCSPGCPAPSTRGLDTSCGVRRRKPAAFSTPSHNSTGSSWLRLARGGGPGRGAGPPGRRRGSYRGRSRSPRRTGR